VHAAVQRVHTAPVFGAESIDVRHEDAKPLRLILRERPERIR
jgi:hypothetical protein